MRSKKLVAQTSGCSFFHAYRHPHRSRRCFHNFFNFPFGFLGVIIGVGPWNDSHESLVPCDVRYKSDWVSTADKPGLLGSSFGASGTSPGMVGFSGVSPKTIASGAVAALATMVRTRSSETLGLANPKNPRLSETYWRDGK